mgnify:CR=1 FL=1
MPSAFKRPCKQPGCRKYAIPGKGYCEEHLKQHEEYVATIKAQRDKYRGTRTERGYSNVWSRASKRYLCEHPLCVECLRQGITTPATEVDHIKPHKGDKELFWDENNWQALCHKCHSRKTAREDGGFGNKVKR